jgi:hypothetical protein
VAIAGKWARAKARQRNGCRSVVPWPGQALGVRAIRGCRWRGPCWQRSIIGSSVGPSFSRSVKPATKRRRRQRRAVLGGDRRQVGQVEGETAYRLPIGRAVAWSGSRGAGNPRLPLAWPVLAALDHRQFGRSFVLSIGEAGHEATTAPGGDRRQVGQGEARQRTGCRSGLPWRGQALGVLAGIGCRRAPGLPPAWFVLAVLDHRQFGRAFVLSIGEAGHEATTAPVSSGAGWRSPASGPGRRRDSVPAADRGCRGVGRISGCLQCSIAGSSVGPSSSRLVKPATKRRRRLVAIAGKWCQGERETAHRLPIGVAVAVVRLSGCLQASVADVRRGCRRRGSCWQCSITGSSVGLSSSRSVKPATKRRRRQCRAVPGGDRRQVGQVEGETAHRLPIGVAVAWSGSRGAGNPRLPLAWPVLAVLDHRQFGRVFVLSIGEAGHEATTAPASSSTGWRSPASGPGRRRDSTPAADRGCRGLVVSGAGNPRLPGVARAARSPAVLPGLRSLDR